MTFESVDPATGEVLETYERASADEREAALARATAAFDEWKTVPIEERTRLLDRAAAVLRENADEYAALMTREMGKPIAQSRAEVEKCAWVCAYYAEHAPAFLADEVVAGEPDARTLVTYQPIGPVLAIMPWNFPLRRIEYRNNRHGIADTTV